MELTTALVLLALAAYGPPILFAVSVARAKRYRREPGAAVVKAFLWGATFAAMIALVVNTFVQGGFVRPALQNDAQALFIVAVVVAPLVEEAVKPLVLYMGSVRRNCDEVMDGLIYGAVAGLGFAATENLLYEGVALFERGPEGFITTAIARTFSATLLHAVAGAIVGYGISLHLNRPHGFIIVLPFYALAVAIHAGYNAVVMIAAAYTILPLIAVVIIGFLYMRRRIGELSMIPPQPDWQVIDEPADHDAPPRPPATTEAPRETWRRVPPGQDRESETWTPVPGEDDERRGGRRRRGDEW